VYRRVWALRGKTPLAWVRPRYRWLYVYGFVRPSTGESEFWLLPTVNAEAFSEVLRRFARLRGSGEGKLLLWTYAASTCTGNRGLKSRLSLPAMSLRRHW
jgi:hypothetical protein